MLPGVPILPPHSGGPIVGAADPSARRRRASGMIPGHAQPREGLWPNLLQSLGFIPGVIVLVFGVLGWSSCRSTSTSNLNGVQLVFKGDASAARTVLSVIAGSLITVAGLTFSITMVVLQLASSQFSPRLLRTFFGDRVTQITIGTYVGTFVYSILVLRAVGSFGEAGFVPRLECHGRVTPRHRRGGASHRLPAPRLADGPGLARGARTSPRHARADGGPVPR